MTSSTKPVHVVGGGLAGSEAAWQLARAGVPVVLHPVAKEILERYYETRGGLNEARLRMARVPDGADLIANRMSGAPGIRIGNVFLMAGVPSITAGMLDALTGTLEGGLPVLSQTVGSWVQESEVADLLLGLPEPGSSFVRYSFDLDKVTQEFRLQSKGGGTFEWMVGAFYTKEDALQSQFAWLGLRDGSPLPAPLDSAYGTLAIINLPSTYKEYALFANGSWRFGERFKIDAGLRQARNDQWFSQNVPTGILAPIGESPGDSSEDVFTWSLSPQFKLSENVMLYARVATGYQPGGPNVALAGVPAQ